MHKVKAIMDVIRLNHAGPSDRAKEYRDQRDLYRKQVESEFYFQCVSRFRADAGKEHVLFEKEESKAGVMGNKTLAEAAGYNLDFEAGLESGSTSALSEAQIRELKEKYDVENMTEEEYQALLKELVDMRVLTTTEASMQFARQIPPCSAMVVPYDGDPEERNRLYRGNYLMKSKKEKDYTEYLLDMIQKRTHRVSPSDALGDVRRFYEKEREYTSAALKNLSVNV